ncbi:MAG: FAD-binding oxidoreductase [Candidatus Saccharimonadales bacterium]
MSKVAQYLQEHLLGEVSTSKDALRHFSTDHSIFQVEPSIVVYPANEHDVRKTTRFLWQLAERGRVIPMTPRGAGTDTSGAALGNGVMMVFPAHMNRIVELDLKSGQAVVEPGLNYGRLQQTLHTHERYIPSYPSSLQFSTLGGAVGNNASGERSYKYGSTSAHVRSLRVVLANGEVITTRRLSKRELGKKMGLSTFEGDIYRKLDAMLDDQAAAVDASVRAVSRNASGYNLADIKHRDGSFDLTPLFVGSQGTLGTITEISLDTLEYNPETHLVMASFHNLDAALAAVQTVQHSKLQPSSIEMVDYHLLDLVSKLNPNLLKSVLPPPLPKVVLLLEFDDSSERARKKGIKDLKKLITNDVDRLIVADDPLEQALLRKIRHSSSILMSHSEGRLKPIPLIDDAIVPLDELPGFVADVYKLFADNKLQVALWGSVGDGLLHTQPFLDLEQLGERQKAFRLLDQYHKIVNKHRGSLTASRGDGRLRGPYLAAEYGHDVYTLFQKVKALFDPYNFLNPGVKINVTTDAVKPLIRPSYGLDRLYKYLPRS